MIAEQVMRRPKCLTSNDTARQAARLMRDEHIGLVPICDGSGRLIGTVTDRDIAVRLVAEDGASDVALSRLMSRDPLVCRSTDDMSTVERLMSDNHRTRVVCIDDHEQPIGVISLSDIAQVEEGQRAGRMLRIITEREVRPH